MSKRKPSATVVSSEPLLQTQFVPKTLGQSKFLRTIIENDVNFVTGPAGSGKSYLTIGLACQYLLEKRFDYLVVARPSVEASPRGLGFVPGNLEEKLSPYMYPAMEHMKKFLGPRIYLEYMRSGVIKLESLEYMRGRTYDNSFMILEEAQNCTTSQLTMFVTRIGDRSKIVINGDVSQTDLRNSGDNSDLMYVISKIERANLDKFGIHHMTDEDIVRNPLIREFLNAMK